MVSTFFFIIFLHSSGGMHVCALCVLLSTDRVAALLAQVVAHAEDYHPPVENPPLDTGGYCAAVNVRCAPRFFEHSCCFSACQRSAMTG